MKSGLEGRNNVAADIVGANLFFRGVSMKSGLEGRNNANKFVAFKNELIPSQ